MNGYGTVNQRHGDTYVGDFRYENGCENIVFNLTKLSIFRNRHADNSDLAFHEPFDGFHFIVRRTFATVEKYVPSDFHSLHLSGYAIGTLLKIPYIMRILLSKKIIKT